MMEVEVENIKRIKGTVAAVAAGTESTVAAK